MSNRPGHRNQRRPRSSERRAATWVIEREKQTLRQGKKREEQPPALPGALVVRREVVSSTEGGLFERQGILDLRAADHGAEVFDRVGTVLISPVEGKNAVNLQRGDFSQVKQNLEAVTETFPSTLDGFIGMAVILGAPPNAPGSRFVGYSFDPHLRDELIGEREQLKPKVGEDSTRGKVIPHITLFSTANQQLAAELKDQLNILRVPLMPVELASAEVIPITHTGHLTA